MGPADERQMQAPPMAHPAPPHGYYAHPHHAQPPHHHHQPSPRHHSGYGNAIEQQWATALCDVCTDDACGFCLCGFFCPCVAFGHNMERLGLSDLWLWPALCQCCCYAVGGSLAGSYLFGGLATGLVQCLPVLQRTALRNSLAARRGYAEDPCCSCCIELWCWACSQTQIRNDAMTKNYMVVSGRHRAANLLGIIHADDKVQYTGVVEYEQEQPLVENRMYVNNNNGGGYGDSNGGLVDFLGGVAVGELVS